MTSRHVALALLVALIGGLLGCSQPPTQPPELVVFVLIDTLRTDRLGTYGYDKPTSPAIDALAEKGLVFENYFVQATGTRFSLPRLFFSRTFADPLFPYDSEVPYENPEALLRGKDPGFVSLNAALEKDGWTTAAVVTHTWLRHDTEFADLFEVYVDLPTEIGADPKVSYPRAEIAVDHALEVIEQHRNDKLFLYIHLMEPHHPRFPEAEALELMPEGVDIEQAASGLFPGGFPRDRGRLLDPNERAYIDALYDGAVLQADKALDRLFTGLGEDLDDALVIVTSDHGENQLEVPGRWGHSGPWYDLVGRVPLILTAPGHIEPGRVSSLTEGIDLAPTVTRILGVPQPEEAVWDGQDLLAMKAGDFEPRSHAVMLGGIRTDAWKVLFEQPPEEIFPLDDLSTVRGVLYDLAADPLESVDVRFRHPEVFVELAQTWRDRLDRPFRRYSIGGVAKPPPGPFAIGARLLEVEDEEAIRTVDFAQWTEPGWQRSWRLHDTVVVAGRGTVPVSGWLPIPNGRYSLIAKVWGRGSLHVADLSLEIDEKRWNSRRPGINIPLGDVTVTDERLLISLAAERPGFALAHIGFVPAGTEDDPERREQLRALGYI